MSEYTPTTEEMREFFCTPMTESQGINEEFHWEMEGRFERWIAEVERAAAEKAWLEGADSVFYNPEIRVYVDYPDENPYRREETE